MKTLLICHHGAAINEEGIARWLGSFSTVVGLVVVREPRGKVLRRIRGEWKRGGILSLIDVALFKAYYALVLARGDARWEAAALDRLQSRYPALPAETPRLSTDSPNSAAAQAFIARHAPDLVIARCKVLLKEQVFSIPRHGTVVLHPGICPEYRNAHGCFWALASADLARVGMTLLKVDRGIDTGPVYGFYTYDFDAATESHVVIQHRVVLDNLDAIRQKLVEVAEERAVPIDTAGRASKIWGQPRLTHYLRWRRQARRRRSVRS